jgi:Zn-dependent protease
MFVPGFGAMVRGRHRLTDPRQEARVALAGPLWGFSAALAVFLFYAVTGSMLARAIAYWGALLNAINLVPFFPLDGGRVFHVLGRRQRWFIVAILGIAWLCGTFWVPESPELAVLFLALLVAAGHAMLVPHGTLTDPYCLTLYISLAIGLFSLMKFTAG